MGEVLGLSWQRSLGMWDPGLAGCAALFSVVFQRMLAWKRATPAVAGVLWFRQACGRDYSASNQPGAATPRWWRW
jgi:hypothetical protein